MITVTWVQSDVVHTKTLKGKKMPLVISSPMSSVIGLWFQIHQFPGNNNHYQVMINLNCFITHLHIAIYR